MAPMDLWERVAGKYCVCGNPATHHYCGVPVCCQCHGGNIFTPEEAAKEHKRIKEQLLGNDK